MKGEFEWDAERYTLRAVYPPYLGGDFKGDEGLRQWKVYMSHGKGNLFTSHFGLGPTPQAAIDACVASLDKYIASRPQGGYNGPEVKIDLDLSFLG